MKIKYNSTLSAPAGGGGDQRRANPIRPSWFALALGGFLFTSIFALSAPPVEAQCQQWDVSGKWQFKQGWGQGAINVLVDLSQTGRTVITGTASHVPPGGDLTNGTVDGTMEGDSFAVKIYWENNTIGVYEGTIRPSGRIEGKGWEQATRRTKVRWYSKTTMKCADAAAPPTNPPPTGPAQPTPKPLKSTGKARETQPSAAAPTITAHPRVVSIPDGQTEGPVTLTWDGGPDHPSAEVWRKEGGSGPETLVTKRPKGTRSVTVERGKNYQFLLIEDGQQLAKAVVLSPR